MKLTNSFRLSMSLLSENDGARDLIYDNEMRGGFEFGDELKATVMRIMDEKNCELDKDRLIVILFANNDYLIGDKFPIYDLRLLTDNQNKFNKFIKKIDDLISSNRLDEFMDTINKNRVAKWSKTGKTKANDFNEMIDEFLEAEL